MAAESGTASDFKDALVKLRAFLTTDATLAAETPAQTWDELLYIEDNVESVTHNMTAASGVNVYASLNRDPRAYRTDGYEGPALTGASGGGTKYFRWKLRTAKAVTRLRMNSGGTVAQTPTAFRLQYSDDDAAWTTALTVTGQTWTVYESKEFAVGTPTGTHLYWRILIDTLLSGTTFRPAVISCYDGAGADDIVNSAWGELYLRGPGLADADDIYIGLRGYRNSAYTCQHLQIQGYTGHITGGGSFFSHPGIHASMAGVAVPLSDTSMPYKFNATGRYFSFVFQCTGSVAEPGHAGLFLPYATPAEYPYPLVMGGSILQSDITQGTSWAAGGHRAFFDPCGNVSSAVKPTSGTLQVLGPDGIWEAYSNINTAGTRTNTPTARAVLPSAIFANGGYDMDTDYGGGYHIEPLQLYRDADPAPSCYFGELDGWAWITGFNNTWGNDGTLSGTDWYVVQNIFRTGVHDFAVMRNS